MIFEQFGRTFETKKAPRETHSLSYAPIANSSRASVAAGLTPERLAAIFRAADGGDVSKQSDLFDQIEERSGHLVGEKTKRVNAILDVPFEFAPASDDARDVKICEDLEAWWGDMTDAPDVLTAMQDAVGKGFAALEINWDVSTGQAVPDSLEFIEQYRFNFTDESGYLTKIPKLITDENLMGMDIPAWRMMMHVYGGKSGHPTRSGIYRVATWNYLFANYAIKDWVVFCEVYGMPLRIGKYESAASKEDKDALKRALVTIGTDMAGIISKSTEIEFIENKGTASGDLYFQLIQFCNKEISKAILGQTLTADVGDKGSYAAANTHNDIRLDLLKADARAVAMTLRHQLFRPWVYFNYGFDAQIPKFDAVWEETEDLKTKMEWVDKLVSRTPVPKTWFFEQFKVPLPKKGEETVGGTDTGVSAKTDTRRHTAKSNAQNENEAHEKALASLSDKVAQNADLGPIFEKIKNALSEAESLTDFRDRIMGLGPDVDQKAFGEMLAQAMAVAELAGRFDV
jgi:phage gp29-like protein